MTDQNTPPRPVLENDTLPNRLVAMTEQRFSLQTLGKGSGKLFVSAMKALGHPVARRYVLPGEVNEKIVEGKRRLAAMPRGTKGLFRRDGSIILAGHDGDLISAATAENLSLDTVYLVRANLRERNMKHSVLTNADMRLATLTRATLDNATINGSDLRRAQMRKINANEMKAENCDFGEVRIYAGWMNRANFKGSSFRGATFSATELNNCDLRDVDFTGASFNRVRSDGRRWMVEMCNANLTGAKFDVTANFAALDLRGATLDGVILIGRDGQPIEGAKLRPDGTVIYTEIKPLNDQPKLGGPST
ncbi:MAG: hypothetical protein Alpg2KO_22380 [Alphaproteobacteria bacterium]